MNMLWKPQWFFSPDDGKPAVPGSRQEEEGNATPGDPGVARKQVEERLKQATGAEDGRPVVEPPAPSEPKGKDSDPGEFVKLKMPDGSEQEVKLEYALELAGRSAEVNRMMEELRLKEEKLRPYEAVDLFVRANPQKNAELLRKVMSGELKLPEDRPAGSPPEDEESIFDRIEEPHQDVKALKSELQEIKQYLGQVQQREQEQALENFKKDLFENGKRQMDNFKVFNDQSMRTIGEYILREKVNNPMSMPENGDAAFLVAEIAKNLESGVNMRTTQSAAQARYASQLAGGPVPAPAPKGDKRPSIPGTSKRLEDTMLRNRLVEELMLRREGG